MKKKALLPFAMASVLAPPASLATTWDIVPDNGAVDGGAGTWNASNTNWTVDSGLTNIAWVSGSDAVFGGTGGAVSTSGALSAGNVSLADGYTLSLNANLSGTGVITLNTGSHLYLAGNVTGTVAQDLNFQGGAFNTGSGDKFTATGRFTGTNLVMAGAGSYGNYATQSRAAINNSYTGSTTLNNNVLRFSSYTDNTGANFTPFGTTPDATVSITAAANGSYGGAGVVFNPGSGGTGKTYMISQNFSLNGTQGKTALISVRDGTVRLTGAVSVATDANAASAVLFETQYGGKDLYLDGILSGSGRVVVSDLSGLYGSGLVHLTNGGNTYSGTISVNTGSGTFGILSLDHANAAQYATINLGGGRLRLNGTDATVSGLTGASAGSSVFTTDTTIRTLTVNNAADNSYAGKIGVSGTYSHNGYNTTVNGANLALVKTGAGTLTLTNTNDYTGTTTINQGKLVVNGSISASSLTTVRADSTLGGTGSVGALRVDANGIVAPGNSAGVLTVAGNLTLAGGYQWDLGALSTDIGSYDRIQMTAGDADITGSALGLNLGSFSPGADPFWQTDRIWNGILDNSGSGSLTGYFAAIDNSAWASYGSFSTVTSGNDVNLVWTAVPEPSGMAIGLLALGGLLRRRR